MCVGSGLAEGRQREALKGYERAIDLARAANDMAQRAHAQRHVRDLHRELGQHRAAVSAAAEAAARSRQHDGDASLDLANAPRVLALAHHTRHDGARGCDVPRCAGRLGAVRRRSAPMDARTGHRHRGHRLPLDALDLPQVNHAAVDVPAGPTFRWHARYTDDGAPRATLSRERGVAEGRPPPVGLTSVPRAMLLASTHPRVQAHGLRQWPATPLVALDSMSHWWSTERAALRKLLPHVHLLLVDDEELTLATGGHGAVETLHALGPAMLVVKHGAHHDRGVCRRRIRYRRLERPDARRDRGKSASLKTHKRAVSPEAPRGQSVC